MGIYLLYKRLKVDHKAAIKSGKFIHGFGIMLIVLGGLAIVGDTSTVAAASFLIILGIVLMRTGSKTKKQVLRINQYIALIVNQHIISLDELARATGNTYAVVCEDLNKMIEKGYLPGAYLNLSIRQIMLQGQKAPIYRANTQGPRKQPRTKVISCKGCGAEMIVAEGTIRKCEYCGTPLQG